MDEKNSPQDEIQPPFKDFSQNMQTETQTQVEQSKKEVYEEKNNWKIWLTLAIAVIIAIGFGFYFLR